MTILPSDLWQVRKFGTEPEQDAYQAMRDEVFQKICPKGNWKMPIDAWIDSADLHDCNLAAEWFTGGSLVVATQFGRMLNVRSGGYYENVGA